jgi:hypothetical protein
MKSLLYRISIASTPYISSPTLPVSQTHPITTTNTMNAQLTIFRAQPPTDKTIATVDALAAKILDAEMIQGIVKSTASQTRKLQNA